MNASHERDRGLLWWGLALLGLLLFLLWAVPCPAQNHTPLLPGGFLWQERWERIEVPQPTAEECPCVQTNGLGWTGVDEACCDSPCGVSWVGRQTPSKGECAEWLEVPGRRRRVKASAIEMLWQNGYFVTVQTYGNESAIQFDTVEQAQRFYDLHTGWVQCQGGQ